MHGFQIKLGDFFPFRSGQMAFFGAAHRGFTHMGNLVDGGVALPAIRLAMGRFQKPTLIDMKDLEATSGFRPGQAGILMTCQTTALIHGPAYALSEHRSPASGPMSNVLDTSKILRMMPTTATASSEHGM